MEYEKHINRLVLGFLKNNCQSAYKAFLKHNFPHSAKHITTRIAGQSLEDILTVYSRICEIIQGYLEETNYCKLKGNEYLSPIHLPEQLLYLLDKRSPAPSPRRRSSTESSAVPESHASDIETTPEYSLPGNKNYAKHNSYYSKAPKRNSDTNKTTSIEKLPTPEKEVISEVMSQTLLQNTEFHEKLAKTINTVLNAPEAPPISDVHDGVSVELDTTIKNVIKRTEADPMFEEVLQEFLGTPIVDSINKVMKTVTPPSSVNNDVPTSKCNKNVMSEETDNSVISGDICNTIVNSSSSNNIIMYDQSLNPLPQTFPSSNAVAAGTSMFLNQAPSLLMVQQPYYLVNQPISVPQPVIMSTSLSTVDQTNVTNLEVGKPNEVRNIQEYLNVYDINAQSPVVKKQRPGLKRVIYPKVKPKSKVTIEIIDSRTNPKSVEDTGTNIGKLPSLSQEPSEVSSEKQTENKTTGVEKDIITPSPSVNNGQKKTPKSGSHVRNLTFPSPMKTVSSDKIKELRDTEEEKSEAGEKKANLCWDANLRKFINPLKEEKVEEAEAKKVKKKSNKKSAKAKNLNVTAEEAKMLEMNLRTPVKEENYGQNEDEIVAMKARCIQEKTPMKTIPLTPTIRSGKNETPFTPMLKANLKEITGGDIFSVDTPNFPTTPGFSFMGNPNNYYWLNEHEGDGEKVLSAIKNEDGTSEAVVHRDKENSKQSPKKSPSKNVREPKVKKVNEKPKKKAATPKTKQINPKKSPVSKTPRRTNSRKPVKRMSKSPDQKRTKEAVGQMTPKGPDDQINWFKMSGANLHRTNLDDAKKEYGFFSVCNFCEDVVVHHDDSIIVSEEQRKSYSESKYKSQKVTLFCKDDEEIDIYLSLTPFVSLLELGLDDEGATKKKAGIEDVDLVESSKKRRHRSDSHSSTSSRKKMKPVDTTILKEVNITSFLSQVHGPTN